MEFVSLPIRQKVTADPSYSPIVSVVNDAFHVALDVLSSTDII